MVDQILPPRLSESPLRASRCTCISLRISAWPLRPALYLGNLTCMTPVCLFSPLAFFLSPKHMETIPTSVTLHLLSLQGEKRFLQLLPKADFFASLRFTLSVNLTFLGAPLSFLPSLCQLQHLGPPSTSPCNFFHSIITGWVFSDL